MIQKTLCFIGAGNMTRSITTGLVTSGYPPELIHATNPSIEKLTALEKDLSIKVSNDNLGAAKMADVIVLAVKPQMMQKVCQQLDSLDLSTKLIITIAAGIEINRYQCYFSQPVKIIRTMPNTPTQIGFGMTGLYAAPQVTEADRDYCQQLMETGGETVWVTQEEELNQVIALAGSAPAYFFLMMEAMIESAKQDKMDGVIARKLVQQAALGAAAMAKQSPQLSMAQLRENVTSKGGTTAQALAAFERADLRGIVRTAMHDCIKRAQEMTKQF